METSIVTLIEVWFGIGIVWVLLLLLLLCDGVGVGVGGLCVCGQGSMLHSRQTKQAVAAPLVGCLSPIARRLCVVVASPFPLPFAFPLPCCCCVRVSCCCYRCVVMSSQQSHTQQS